MKRRSYKDTVKWIVASLATGSDNCLRDSFIKMQKIAVVSSDYDDAHVDVSSKMEPEAIDSFTIESDNEFWGFK